MKAPYKIVDAEGVYLYTEDNKMIDSISSWWSTIHGYKHPVITKAIKDQADKFSHVMLGGLTHDPALQLSAKLADWRPGCRGIWITASFPIPEALAWKSL